MRVQFSNALLGMDTLLDGTVEIRECALRRLNSKEHLQSLLFYHGYVIEINLLIGSYVERLLCVFQGVLDCEIRLILIRLRVPCTTQIVQDG